MNNNELVIDLGHGGTDPGAVSGNFKESDMNLVTGLSCGKECERHGVKVHYTRTTNKTLSLAERCSIANKTNAKWFISIHHNAGGGDRGEVIHSYVKGDGLKLANNIGSSLKNIGQTTVKIYDRKNGNKDYYYVINNTKMHSNIVEVCFIDNKEDIKIADTKSEQERNGIAIAHGILKTMGISIKNNSNSSSAGTHGTSFPKGSYTGRKAKVIANELNVRYNRGVENNIVGVLKQGQIVSLEWCESNGWISIQGFKGYKGLGYVNSKYLELI